MSEPSFGVSSPYPLPGEVLDGKYRIERLLGEGGMGAVAKATHLLRRAPVALKFMSPAVTAVQGAVERFVNEGVAASRIDSDHVVKVFDVGRMASGAPYLVMEFLDGRDLAQILADSNGRLDTTRAVHFIVQILRALQTAHAAGIVHRDMKPSNCFVITKDGEPDFVKLVDFGISKVRTDDEQGRPANLTRTNSALGTPLYMSPEQARSAKDVDHRTDLYSVGAILYEMLAGRTPYTAESGEYTEILFKIFTTEPTPLQTLRPDLAAGLCAVVHRALTRDLAVRFASAQDMADALAPYADERSAQVLARMRGGGRGRSVAPTAARAVMPPSEQARASPEEATARTFAAEDAGLELVRAGPVATRGEVTREGGASGKRAGGIAIGAAVLVGLGAAAGVVALRARSLSDSRVDATRDPAAVEISPQAPNAATPGPSRASSTPAAPQVPPSASTSASAAFPPAKPPVTTRPPPNQSGLPSTLGDLKLH